MPVLGQSSADPCEGCVHQHRGKFLQLWNAPSFAQGW